MVVPNVVVKNGKVSVPSVLLFQDWCSSMLLVGSVAGKLVTSSTLVSGLV